MNHAFVFLRRPLGEGRGEGLAARSKALPLSPLPKRGKKHDCSARAIIDSVSKNILPDKSVHFRSFPGVRILAGRRHHSGEITISPEENKALVRRFYQEIDNGNVEAIDELDNFSCLIMEFPFETFKTFPLAFPGRD